MIRKINNEIHQITFQQFGSYVYLLQIENKNILIDTSSPENTEELISHLHELNLSPTAIDIIILTHNHWDHVGGLDIFTKAKIYGSKKDFGENLDDIHELKIPELKIFNTPGHSKGAICILYRDFLFSGDTVFHDGGIGRTDFPGGDDNEMEESLKKISKLEFKTLLPGH